MAGSRRRRTRANRRAHGRSRRGGRARGSVGATGTGGRCTGPCIGGGLASILDRRGRGELADGESPGRRRHVQVRRLVTRGGRTRHARLRTIVRLHGDGTEEGSCCREQERASEVSRRRTPDHPQSASPSRYDLASTARYELDPRTRPTNEQRGLFS